jgi:hypothetical protein
MWHNPFFAGFFKNSGWCAHTFACPGPEMMGRHGVSNEAETLIKRGLRRSYFTISFYDGPYPFPATAS